MNSGNIFYIVGMVMCFVMFLTLIILFKKNPYVFYFGLAMCSLVSARIVYLGKLFNAKGG